MMGRLKFRTSYGQNQLAHAVEVSKLAGILAACDVYLGNDSGVTPDGSIGYYHALTQFERLQNLPKAVLAAIVLVAVKGLIDVRELARLWRLSRFEFTVAMVAFVGVLSALLSLELERQRELGILVGGRVRPGGHAWHRAGAVGQSAPGSGAPSIVNG